MFPNWKPPHSIPYHDYFDWTESVSLQNRKWEETEREGERLREKAVELVAIPLQKWNHRGKRRREECLLTCYHDWFWSWNNIRHMGSVVNLNESHSIGGTSWSIVRVGQPNEARLSTKIRIKVPRFLCKSRLKVSRLLCKSEH